MKRPPGERAILRQPHPYEWLWEPLAGDATFVLRSMFGTKTAYLDGRIVLCFSAGEEPWRGVLVCTDRERQPALQKEFPELRPHAILPKWLYLPESDDRFEAVATALVGLARRRDPRLGVTPAPRKKRKVVAPGRPAAKRRRR
jgi:hypothetical protein